MPPLDPINKKLIALLKQSDSKIKLLLQGYEGQLKGNYRLALIEIKSKIARMFEKYGDDVKYADLISYNRLKNLENEIIEQIKILTNENIKTTRAGLKEFYSENYYRTAYSLEQSTGLKLGYGLLNTNVINASLLNPLDRIKWSERMKDNAQVFVKQIRSSLTQGLIQGEGYAKIARGITEKTGMDFMKSVRIIRTEGHRVQNAARVVSFKKGETAAERLGIESSRIWIHSGNPREPRPDHVQMDGVEADEDGIFTLPDGTTTEGPGLSGVAEHDINCGCTTGLKFKSLKALSLKDYAAKNYNSFDDWQTEKGIK
jgi:hypothetical protein